MHSFSSLYNENTVISKEYTGPLDFDLTGGDCIWNTKYPNLLSKLGRTDSSQCLNGVLFSLFICYIS